jgi:phage terminase large subunit
MGIEPEVVPAYNPMDGINAVRRLLDRAVIDPVRCADGLDLFRNYKYEWQERKRVLSPHPRHDFASHCADALRTFAAGPRSECAVEAVRAPSPSHWAS